MPTLSERIDALATRIGNHIRDAIVPRLLPGGGTPGQMLGKAGAPDYAVSWQTPTGAVATDPRRMPTYATDFLVANTNQIPFVGTAVSAGALSAALPAALGANHPGVVLLRSASTANSGYRYTADVGPIRIGGGETFDLVFRTTAAFTNNTVRFGLLDTTGSADPFDGAYFELAATGVLVGKTASNQARSTTATLATLAPNTWYHARVAVAADATAVTFTLWDDAGGLLGTAQLTTNIPTAVNRECGAGVVATSAGTTAVDLIFLDYMSIAWTKPLTRGAA